MKRYVSVPAIILLIFLTVSQVGAECPIDVYFSPNGGGTDAIVRELGGAKSSVYVQAYSFTSAPIAQALLKAAKRGVKVQAILDKSNATAKYSAADFLKNQGIVPLIDSTHAIAHNKIIVVDESTVITGSFNFTKAAEKSNAENLLVIRDKDLAAKYLKNWKEHASHSEPYQGRAGKKQGKVSMEAED